MVYKTLGRTGASVSVIGFGCSPLGGVFGTVSPSEAERAVHFAIDSGINFFDVAPYYGNTLAEQRLGDALRGRRHGIVLATKCGRYGFDDFDFSRGRIEQSIDESLQRLQTDYLDLFQAHDIEFGDERQIVEETIPTMRDVQRSGKARWIGITGYSLGMLKRVGQATNVESILSYCHCNLLIDDLEAVLSPVAEKYKLALINASPLHMGILSPEGPPPWHPAPESVKKAGRTIIQYCSSQGLDPVAVALRFSLDRSSLASTLVGMTTPEQVRQNLRALEISVAPSLYESIREIAGQAHGAIWPSGRPENAPITD